MRANVRGFTWERISRLRRMRRAQNIATLGLVILGPFMALLTFLVLGPLQEGANSPTLRLILLADLVYVLVVAALVLQRVGQMIAARRAKSAGSRLHLRLTGVFALLALIPTVLVAVFAVLTLNIGLEGWFSERVRQVVGSSLAAATAYEAQQREDLVADTQDLGALLNEARAQRRFLSDGDLRQVLTQGQSQVQRGLPEAFVIDSSGAIRARGARSYFFDYEQPSAEQIAAARNGAVVVIQDWDANEFRALMGLTGFLDRLLYVTRDVDGAILNLLDETQENVRLYNQLEAERGRLLFNFGLIYLGFALILILAAVWLGLWFAERLARPVGRLAYAAQKVREGDLDVHVREEDGDDEISMLGRLFNQMTRQIKLQRDTLLENNRQIESRRRMFDSVLSSVTAGVIGVDDNGQIGFINRSAKKLLELRGNVGSRALAQVVPEFSALFDRLQQSKSEAAQEEIQLVRSGRIENLLVRVATRWREDGTREGYVIAFDDVTDLVSAQRMAAWGDVARRIAHEIKNPLTPIQLSAERVKRKFGKLLDEEDAESLGQLTDVIVRQTNDLRRIVDEFSKFARMPEPERRRRDLNALLQGAVVLQQQGQPDNQISLDVPEGPVWAELDETMIGQALTNVLKNAGEAIETRWENSGVTGQGRVHVDMKVDGDSVVISITDNGAGLPADRSRLFEPYVTTREKGTGLGLPIVRKIVEEHGGALMLLDGAPFDDDPQIGACVRMTLPVSPKSPESKAIVEPPDGGVST